MSDQDPVPKTVPKPAEQRRPALEQTPGLHDPFGPLFGPKKDKPWSYQDSDQF